MAGGADLQLADHFTLDIANKKLRHRLMISMLAISKTADVPAPMFLLGAMQL